MKSFTTALSLEIKTPDSTVINVDIVPAINIDKKIPATSEMNVSKIQFNFINKKKID